jgi:tetratricopeptide (TPR) repeat protein
MPTADELYNEADRLKDQGKLAEAAAKLEDLLKEDESFTLAHSALAVILGRLNRHPEAIAHAQRVCQLEPQDPFSFTALSVTCQRAFAGTQNPQYIRDAEDAMARSRLLQSGG